uniref:hypothetical protein n=1 Tax=Bacillus pumilus TaxID=1408 RepID=UPI001C92DE89
DEVGKGLVKTDVLKLEELKEGMEVEGRVRKVVELGGLVDIGVKQEGVVDIWKVRKGFVKDGLEVV